MSLLLKISHGNLALETALKAGIQFEKEIDKQSKELILLCDFYSSLFRESPEILPLLEHETYVTIKYNLSFTNQLIEKWARIQHLLEPNSILIAWLYQATLLLIHSNISLIQFYSLNLNIDYTLVSLQRALEIFLKQATIWCKANIFHSDYFLQTKHSEFTSNLKTFLFDISCQININSLNPFLVDLYILYARLSENPLAEFENISNLLSNAKEKSIDDYCLKTVSNA